MDKIKKHKNWFKELISKFHKKPQPLFKNTAYLVAEQIGGEIPVPIPATNTTIAWVNEGVNISESKKESITDTRIEKRPIEVWQELCLEIPKIDFSQLDLQIKTVEKRKKILEEEIGIKTSDEKIALKYLYARKKLQKLGKNEFLWQTTTNKLIEELQRKYKIQIVGLQGYYKCVSNEALEELEKYSKAWKKISNEVPTINLIIDINGKEHKKDPIIIASSPFGNWWFILGAWDKEIKYVDDIVYNGK